MKYLLKLLYLGTAYSGFQVQPNGDTVQGRLCDAGKTLFGVDCAVTGCSRTDSGVHAKEYYATLETHGGADIPAEKLPRAINTYLPKDISVITAKTVDDGYSVRRHVAGKEYEYLILNSPVGDPFLLWQGVSLSAPAGRSENERGGGAFYRQTRSCGVYGFGQQHYGYRAHRYGLSR